MQHLDTERIAAFDHDAPTAGELAHLEACGTCRKERAAFSALSTRALQLVDAPAPASMPRLTSWDALSSQLRAEGLIKTPADASHGGYDRDVEVDTVTTERVVSLDSRRADSRSADSRSAAPVRVRNEWWRMAAAAVMLVAGGVVWGRSSANVADIAPQSSDVPITSNLGLGLGSSSFSSVEEASKALARTERDFNRISLWITANDPSASAPDVLRRRLAQLDQVVAASKTAWDAARQDKVLEHYYKSAFAARELTIEQLGNALPPGRSIERF